MIFCWTSHKTNDNNNQPTFAVKLKSEFWIVLITNTKVVSIGKVHIEQNIKKNLYGEF